MSVHSLFLKYFHEACKTASFRHAAKNLHVTPSALSRKISEVEKSLNIQLFRRSLGGVELTDAGRIMRTHVDETLKNYRQTVSEIKNLNKISAGQITIAGPSSVIPTLLPAIMSRFHEIYPQVITAFKGTSDIDVKHLIHLENVDIVLGFDLQRDKTVREISRCKLEVGAIVGPGHPIGERETVHISDCLAYPLVLPDTIWPLRKQLDTTIQSQPVDAEILAYSDSIEYIRETIRVESCIGFATRLGFEIDISEKRLRFIPLVHKKPIIQDFVVVCRPDFEETRAGRFLSDLFVKQLEKYH